MSKYLMYVSAAALLALPAAADVWDTQTFSDNSSINTRNQLLHGTRQDHDLGARPGSVADEDWYRMPIKPFASYEVIVDSASGDLGAGLSLQRLPGDGTTVYQNAVPAVAGAEGASLSLRFASPLATTIDDQFIRVSGADCGGHCGPDDVYTIRVRETTINVPRFNNAGGQSTVLLVQNASEAPVLVFMYFWDANGMRIETVPNVSVTSKGELVMNLANDALLAGKSGSITIAHDGGYGALVVKAVSLESTTGFTFDTPGVYVPD